MLAHLHRTYEEAQQTPMAGPRIEVNNFFHRDRLETLRDRLEGNSRRKQVSLDRNRGPNGIDKMRRSSRLRRKDRAKCRAYTNQAWLPQGQRYSSVEQTQLPHLRLLNMNLPILHQQISLRYRNRTRGGAHNRETGKTGPAS